jgi:sulfate/thiosulfate transport system ATP-binding protein
MSISIREVSKRFGSFVALDRVSLEVPNGSLLALLGPSGSGKTTLLRIIAGLEVADAGSVLHHEEDITHHSARDRQVGFVFQHYALFRHMTVAENIGYGLRVRKAPKALIRERVGELLKLIRLEGLQGRYPGQLSGGQRQRVALARALAAQPRVLLLDEPFGALDAKVRQELRQWLRRLHEEIHVTSIFVTHDQEEAFEVADRVVVTNEGRIEQVGTPEEVYERPATPFVCSFLGDVNLFRGRVDHGRARIGGGEIAIPGHEDTNDAPMIAYARTYETDLASTPDGEYSIEATVRHLRAVGPIVRLELERAENGERIEAQLPRARFEELALAKGDRVFVKPRNLRVFLTPSEGTPEVPWAGGLNGDSASNGRARRLPTA